MSGWVVVLIDSLWMSFGSSFEDTHQAQYQEDNRLGTSLQAATRIWGNAAKILVDPMFCWSSVLGFFGSLSLQWGDSLVFGGIQPLLGLMVSLLQESWPTFAWFDDIFVTRVLNCQSVTFQSARWLLVYLQSQLYLRALECQWPSLWGKHYTGWFEKQSVWWQDLLYSCWWTWIVSSTSVIYNWWSPMLSAEPFVSSQSRNDWCVIILNLGMVDVLYKFGNCE